MSYRIKYRFEMEKGKFEKPTERNPNAGFCDAFMFVSILKPGGDAGEYSTMIMTKDGTRPDGDDALPDTDLFKVWAMMAAGLPGGNLPEWQKQIMREAHEKIKAKILAGRAQQEVH